MTTLGKRVVALLPMKAHSARVKAKNFRMIAGKPLFRWVLDSLCASSLIDSVVINTDARSILSDNGLHDGDYDGQVIIRDRREEICGDFVSMNLVLEDDIKSVDADLYFMTHTTNPLLSATTIDHMFSKFLDNQESDSLFTVNRHHTRFYTGDGDPINHDPDNLIRTQDLSPYFEENSVGYIFSRDSFAKTNARIGTRPILYETPALESIDIDEQADWVMAEALLKHLRLDQGEHANEGEER